MDTKNAGLFHYRTLLDKERKNLAILELIRKNGPISRTEISHVTDINIVSISNYIKDYIAKSIVVETGWDVSSGGRRPELVELNTKGIAVIGLDVNLSDITATITNMAMEVLGKVRTPLPAGGSGNITARSIEVLDELIKKSNVQQGSIRGIGIGVSGSPGLFMEMRRAIQGKFGIDTFIGNDASCAAYGEKKLSAQANVEDLLYMYSDVGVGIVVRGDIYFGAGGNAGENQISKEHISKEEEFVMFKNAQYLRPWGADLGITQMARHEIEKGIGTKIVACAKGDAKNINTQVVIEAAKQDDDIAGDIIRNAGTNLGIRIAYLVNLFNPEVVVIGGGIETAGNLILEPIRRAVKKLAFSDQANIVKIIASALGEDSVSLGAASLVIREIFLKA